MNTVQVVTANGTSFEVYSVDHLEHKDRLASIYMIYNKVNRKVYIGQTSHTYKRKYAHFSCFKLQSHYNYYMLRSYNKYGEDSFEFYVLEFIDNLDTLNERELYYIKLCESRFKDYGYNMKLDSYKRDGENISNNTGLEFPKARKWIVQLDMDGNFINEFKGIGVAAKSTNSPRDSVGRCANQQRYSSNNYFWIFSEIYYAEDFDFNKYTTALQSKSCAINTKQNRKHEYIPRLHTFKTKRGTPTKIVVQLDLMNNVIKEWDSAIQTQSSGFTVRKVYACCNPKDTHHQTHKGFKWMYKEDFEKQNLNN